MKTRIINSGRRAYVVTVIRRRRVGVRELVTVRRLRDAGATVQSDYETERFTELSWTYDRKGDTCEMLASVLDLRTIKEVK